MDETTLITLVLCIGSMRKYHHWKAEMILHVPMLFSLMLEMNINDINGIVMNDKFSEISNNL